MPYQACIEASEIAETKVKLLRKALALKGTTMTDQKYMRPGLGFAQGKAVEEAGEFLAAMGKTQRWGWDSFNPELPPEQRETNAAWVRREMSDLRGALDNLEREMNIALVQEPRTAAGSLD